MIELHCPLCGAKLSKGKTSDKKWCDHCVIRFDVDHWEDGGRKEK